MFLLLQARRAELPAQWQWPSGMSHGHHHTHNRRNIIVAAFDQLTHNEIESLTKTIPPDGTITVVSQTEVHVPEGEWSSKWIQGHPGSGTVLEQAGLANADTLLIAGLEKWTNTEADVQVCCCNCVSSTLSRQGWRMPTHC